MLEEKQSLKQMEAESQENLSAPGGLEPQATPQQYVEEETLGQAEMLQYITEELVKTQGSLKFIGIAHIVIGSVFGLLALIGMFSPTFNSTMVGEGGLRVLVTFIVIFAFIANSISSGMLYLSSASKLAKAKLSSNPAIYKAGMDKIASIIRIQGRTWVILAALMLLMAIMIISLIIVKR